MREWMKEGMALELDRPRDYPPDIQVVSLVIMGRGVGSMSL
jgi:hypothetical protein